MILSEIIPFHCEIKVPVTHVIFTGLRHELPDISLNMLGIHFKYFNTERK